MEHSGAAENVNGGGYIVVAEQIREVEAERDRLLKGSGRWSSYMTKAPNLR
jgi:hypothetical protein